ncbi:thioredoxin family protein [Fodinibius sp. SL11]|uniref:thioredoxin family protein n=1 Tax=Fodinibius sp. SL11 TaxID=3425690 RepID=UPI003F884ADB
MRITVKILQSACNCSSSKEIKDEIKQAADEEGLSVEIEETSDLQETMKYGTTNFPALVIDEEVRSYENIGGLDGLKQLLNRTQ